MVFKYIVCRMYSIDASKPTGES